MHWRSQEVRTIEKVIVLSCCLVARHIKRSFDYCQNHFKSTEYRQHLANLLHIVWKSVRVLSVVKGWAKKRNRRSKFGAQSRMFWWKGLEMSCV